MKKKTAPQPLTRMEQKYFDLLMSNPDGVHRDVLDALHINGLGSNAIDRHVANMRKKLAGTWSIEPVRGFGYRMTKALV